MMVMVSSALNLDVPASRRAPGFAGSRTEPGLVKPGHGKAVPHCKVETRLSLKPYLLPSTLHRFQHPDGDLQRTSETGAARPSFTLPLG